MSERYRIDELARVAGTTVRNTRSYQEKGLLPAPIREGRVAYYSEAHVARLRMIGALLERGFSLHAIAELVTSLEEGKDVRELIGLEEALTSPFSDEEPAIVEYAVLAKMFGSDDPVFFLKATQIGLLEATPEGLVRVPSMRLLKVGADLHGAGVPIPKLLSALARLRDDVDGLAGRLVRLVLDEVLRPRLDAHPDLSNASELAALVRAIRPLAKRAVDAELSRALERHVRLALGKELPILMAVSEGRKKPKAG